MPKSTHPTTPQIDVQVTGTLSAADRHYAIERISSLAEFAGRRLRGAHLVFEASRHHPAGQRVTISATLDVAGRAVIATAEAATHREAVDQVRAHLRSRLVRRRRGPARVYGWVSGAVRRR